MFDLEFHPLTDLRVLEILAVTLFLCPLASSAHSFWHWQMEGKPLKLRGWDPDRRSTEPISQSIEKPTLHSRSCTDVSSGIDGIGYKVSLFLTTCIAENLVQFLQSLPACLWNQEESP